MSMTPSYGPPGGQIEMVKLIRSAQDLGVTNPTAQIEGEAEADEMILVENGKWYRWS